MGKKSIATANASASTRKEIGEVRDWQNQKISGNFLGRESNPALSQLLLLNVIIFICETFASSDQFVLNLNKCIKPYKWQNCSQLQFLTFLVWCWRNTWDKFHSDLTLTHPPYQMSHFSLIVFASQTLRINENFNGCCVVGKVSLWALVKCSGS